MSFQVELVGLSNVRVVVMGEEQAKSVVKMLDGIAMECPVPIVPTITASEQRITHSRAWQAFKSLVNRMP